MDNIALLWWEDHINWSDGERPFTKDWKNEAYAEYVEIARERGVEFYVGEYRWYDDGALIQAWYWDGDEWSRKGDVPLGGVYDLFRNDEDKMKYKERMDDEVGIMNEPRLSYICDDKLETYRRFREYSPETRKATRKNLKEILERSGKALLKPRYGTMGRGIERIEDMSGFDNPDPENVLVQEFVETEGVGDLGVEGPHDLRILLVNHEFQYSYLRLPEEGFLSNVAQGGSIRYVDRDDVPEEALEIVESVREEFQEFHPCIYTVDMMFDGEGEPVLVELNSQPAVYYHDAEFKSRERTYPAMENLIDAITSLSD